MGLWEVEARIRVCLELQRGQVILGIEKKKKCIVKTWECIIENNNT